MKKDLSIIFGLFLLIVALLIFGKGFTTASLVGPAVDRTANISQKGKVPLSVKTLSIDAVVAKTPAERKKGLSKKETLPLNTGLLFVFEKSGRFGFWMKDMKFAIDIIWIDDNKKIAEITKNIPPEPQKRENDLTIYRPSNDVMYVLEVNAGLSDFNNLEVGDTVNFNL